jgi:transcriptional regulator with XRE-family HTH domain
MYKQQLGELIRELREELGLTQKQLADRSHVAESQTVSRWERGERAPQDLEAVAAALESTVPEMLRRIEPVGQKQRRSMNADDGRSQLDRIEQRLERAGEREDVFHRLIEKQNDLLRRQSEILTRIEKALERDESARRQLVSDGEAWADAAIARARAALGNAPEDQGSAPKEPATSGTSKD